MKRSLPTIAMTDKEFHAKLTSADIPHLVSTYLRPVAVAWLLRPGTRYLIFAIDASIGNILTGALQAFLRQNLPSVAPINPRGIEWPLCLGYVVEGMASLLFATILGFSLAQGPEQTVKLANRERE